MKSKYLPELVIGWILAVAIVVGLTSCSGSRAIQTSQTPHVVKGTSEWKYVELKGNKH